MNYTIQTQELTLPKCIPFWSKSTFPEKLQDELQDEIHNLDMEPYLTLGGWVADGPNVEELEIDEKTSWKTTGSFSFEITETDVHTGDSENHTIEAWFVLHRPSGRFEIERM